MTRVLIALAVWLSITIAALAGCAPSGPQPVEIGDPLTIERDVQIGDPLVLERTG